MKGRKRGELAVVAAFVLLGFLLGVQLKSVRLHSAVDATSASRLETLQELYNDLSNERDGLADQLATAQKELEDYRQAAASGEGSEALRQEVDYLSMVAGLTDVEGPGVMVVLQDSTAENTTGDEADYLIHDSDLLSVINELRDAGAQALSLNGQRILATSEIRCAGSVVLINGQRVTAPFVIYAIGDPTTLHNALTMRGGVVDVLSQWGIQVQVTQQHIPVFPVEKYTVDRDAKGIDFALLHPKALQLRHHVLAGHHIGIHPGGNPGPMYAIVGEDTDEGGGKHAVLLQIGNHLRGKGMGGENHVRVVPGNGLKQQIAEQSAELGHQV